MQKKSNSLELISSRLRIFECENAFCRSVWRLQDLVGGKEATTLWENSTKNREDGDNKIDQNHVKNFFSSL